MGVFKKITAIISRTKHQRAVARIANRERKKVIAKPVTVISQNCIGGVFYHDMKWPFLSPTINLFFTAEDFVKLAREPKRYFEAELSVEMGPEYPVGTLEDIKVYFMHYDTCEEAREAWNRRVVRVDYDRIVIFSTDMEGFNNEVFEQWKTIPYPKVLFTADPRFSEEGGSVLYPEYQENGIVPDLIPKREFYKDDVLISVINQQMSRGSAGGSK